MRTLKLLMTNILVESVQSGVKVEPSFCISTPHVSRYLVPFMDPRPREGVPQSPETKPLRPDVSTQPPDFRVFQLPKSAIVTFDGSP